MPRRKKRGKKSGLLPFTIFTLSKRKKKRPKSQVIQKRGRGEVKGGKKEEGQCVAVHLINFSSERGQRKRGRGCGEIKRARKKGKKEKNCVGVPHLLFSKGGGGSGEQLENDIGGGRKKRGKKKREVAP